MNFKKIKPKTINDNKKKISKNNKIIRYENNNDYLFGQNINQSLSENERIIKNYNKKLFISNENEKELGNMIVNKISRNEKDINDYNNYKNNSYMTEPNNKYIMINEMKLNDINNIDNSINSNNNNSLLKDLDLIYNNNQLSKTENKEKIIDYNDFLKNQFEKTLKNDESDENIKILELNNKELIKRCEELIEDNRLLNSALNERTSKLNKIIKENVSLKAQINQLNINAKKTEQNIIVYEKQIQNFKYEVDNYQKLINELKGENKKLNNENNNELQNNLENDFKNQIKEEILSIKKNLEEINIQSRNKYSLENNSKYIENDYNNIYEENKLLKEKINDLKSQNELMKEENKKMLTQNNIYHTQIDTYINQINDLSKIIENKDNLINILKEKEKDFENKELIKNNSCSNLKIEKTELYNEDIIKLMKDNKDNKFKLELLNDKLKTFDIIEKKYDELINYKIIKDNEINNVNNNEKHNSPKKEKNEESELIKVKNNETRLKEENIELNKKIKELNIGLERISNKNKNLIEELNEKQNEIEKLKKEINEKDRLYKILKTENNTKIKECEINIKKYKEELIEKNEIINNLKNDKEKIKLELDFKTKEEELSNKEDKKNNNNINKNEEGLNEKNIKDEIQNINIIEKNNNKECGKDENKKEENEVDNKKDEKKEGRKYIPSLRNRFLRRREEEKKLKEKEKNEKINSQNETNININNENENNENKEKEMKEKEEERLNHGNRLEEEKDEVKESIRQMNRKKNFSHKPRFTTKNYNLEEEPKPFELLDTQIDDKIENKENKEKKLYLYGLDRNDYFHIFDIINKKYEKTKIVQLNVDEKSLTFKKDYQYEGTILYNTLNGIYILTGEKVDSLYYFNSMNNTISKICKFNYGHDNGSIMYDDKGNNLFVFGGKKMKSCEYYNFNDKKVYEMPDLITDRANASFIISNDKIFGFFGFSYEKNNYANNIEYIEYNNKEKWIEIKDINLLEKDITFDMESMATTYYKNNEEEIMIYDGIKGDNEDFITDSYLIYNTKNNEMRKIKAWEIVQFKLIGKKWKNYKLKKTDPQGFHFAKNTRFLNLNNFDGYSESIILIDYKNNIHFVDQKKESIEIYRGNI